MAKVQAVKEPNALIRYYRETVGELRKVVWPTREEALRLTGLVLLVIIIMSMILGLFDLAFAEVIKLLVGLGG